MNIFSYWTFLTSFFTNSKVDYIPDEYIITFKDCNTFANQMIGKVLHVYECGYSTVLTNDELYDLNYESIQYIEKNKYFSINDIQQNPKNWGLERLTTTNLPLVGYYNYDPNGGSGVDCYVIDTGINTNHSDFQGRARWGITYAKGEGDFDGNGHGTHVASTIGGVLSGVAKNVNLIAVKVLTTDGYGSTSDILKGIEWVVGEYLRNTTRKAIINMSLGGSKSRILDEAVNSAVKRGVLVVVASGNENSDSCFTSPGGASHVVTVSATDDKDNRAYFSNWGSCVNIFAPGHFIVAAWKGCDNCYKTLSGTSMASPHIAGVLAVLHSRGNFTNKQVVKKLYATGLYNYVKNPGLNTTNLLVHL